jgi:hypothetical protein
MCERTAVRRLGLVATVAVTLMLGTGTSSASPSPTTTHALPQAVTTSSTTKDVPVSLVKAQIVAQCPGKKDLAEGVFTSLLFKAQIEKQKLPRPEGNRMVTRDLWGPSAAATTSPLVMAGATQGSND